MLLSGQQLLQCSISKFINISFTSLTVFLILNKTANASSYPRLELPDPMVFVQAVEEKAFSGLGEVFSALVIIISIKWMINALTNLSK